MEVPGSSSQRRSAIQDACSRSLIKTIMYDSRIPQSAIPVARETLAMSDAMRGLSAMTAPNTGMTQMDDMQPMTNAAATTFGQSQLQTALGTQKIMQDMQTAAPQAAAAGRGQAIAATTQANQQAIDAQMFMNDAIMRQLDASGNGGALMQLNALIQSPEREAFVNNIATSRAMFTAQAPELGAYAAQTQQYRA